jgi:hypothetical protein
MEEARAKLLPSLLPFLDRLAGQDAGGAGSGAGVVADQPG